MKKLVLLLGALLCLGAVDLGTNAQVCGDGYRSYRVFVQNGQNAVNLRYELVEVMPKDLKSDYESVARYLSRTFFPYKATRTSRFWVTESHNIEPETAEAFMKNYKASMYLPHLADESHNQIAYSGEASTGVFSFYTIELFDRPYLLKIFADNYQPVYILADHLGGCTKTEDVLLKHRR